MRHELKTDPGVFGAVADGTKTYEIRKNDRAFCVGDTLVLKETRHSGAEMAAGAPLLYTGRQVVRHVSHALYGPIYGLADGWAILSLAQPQRDDVAWLHENKASLEYQERRYKWAGPPHWRLTWGDYCIVRLTPQACISEARAIQALKA